MGKLLESVGIVTKMPELPIEILFILLNKLKETPAQNMMSPSALEKKQRKQAFTRD